MYTHIYLYIHTHAYIHAHINPPVYMTLSVLRSCQHAVLTSYYMDPQTQTCRSVFSHLQWSRSSIQQAQWL